MRVFCIISIVCLLAGSGFGQSTQPAKKLIEFGWDEPDTAFMRAHISQMEQTPFSGTVFNVQSDPIDGKPANFMNEVWGKRAFKIEQFSKAIEDLQATHVSTFTDNFLRFNVLPGDVDWFDNFDPITGNAKVAAQIAKAGKAKGILFDIEMYGSPIWQYAKARDAATKTFAQYAAQAHQRGRALMTAFQEGMPDVTVFMTWGYSLPHAECGVSDANLPKTSYGLLKPFLDGMYEAAQGKSKIVDGFESSYGYKTQAQFDAVPIITKQTILPWLPDPKQYLGHTSQAFGLWLDNDWRTKGWDLNDFSKNYFTPAEFEQSVRLALKTSDEYVWIYTEEPWWWKGQSGAAEKLPNAYVQAIRRAAGK